MKWVQLASCLVLATALAAGAAWADQNDPQLNALFARLQQAGSPADAASIEREIWSIWRQTDNDKARQLLSRGGASMAIGDLDDALQAFDQVIEQAPGFAEGWNSRATVLYLLGKYQRSADDIARTLALEPRHFGALSGLGLAEMSLENYAAALDAFRRALAVNPQMAGPQRNIEIIQHILDRRII